MTTEEHVEKFFEMFPKADPVHQPAMFKYYLKLYKYFHSEKSIQKT